MNGKQNRRGFVFVKKAILFLDCFCAKKSAVLLIFWPFSSLL
jgi:hypothetical protein